MERMLDHSTKVLTTFVIYFLVLAVLHVCYEKKNSFYTPTGQQQKLHHHDTAHKNMSVPSGCLSKMNYPSKLVINKPY